MNLRTNLSMIDGLIHVVPAISKPLAVIGHSGLREVINRIVVKLLMFTK